MLSARPHTDLWHAFRQGDQAAFQQIYGLYARDLLNYGNKVTRDVPLIEDSIHDLFIELWQSRANLSDTDSIRFYLFRSLRNKITKTRNRDLFFQASDINDAPLAADDFIIENTLIEGEEVHRINQQLLKSFALLTPRQQEALNLRFYQHFSNEEIAQIMGVNYQSACRFIYAALKTLREVVRILSVGLLWVGLEGF
ncbi:RNA polymerase sigma factor [Spirosoma fluviale]|uniref:RNA polymerase sigma factor, sigma-70 family n=1 Tax=Spirosoma fluviale TaxID=1597977 RepID=A0A286GBW1_9BACT|nr:sigma-70 family RNA polymerase sigma factor [Spirosoma fluviale]SOD92484.1 RNA polymerase sigma factor, sigma-70 family [Spirosoma fluviale]